MSEPRVQSLDERLFTALGITRGRGEYSPRLSEIVIATVPLPLSAVGVEAQLGFNDDQTSNDNAFIRFGSLGALAANSAHVQLFNPAASSKVFLLDGVSASGPSGATSISLTFHNTALAVLIGTVLNKRRSGGNGLCQVRSDHFGAIQGTVFDTRPVLASTSTQWVFDPPILLVAGQGVLAANETVNTSLSACFMGREYNA